MQINVKLKGGKDNEYIFMGNVWLSMGSSTVKVLIPGDSKDRIFHYPLNLVERVEMDSREESETESQDKKGVYGVLILKET